MIGIKGIVTFKDGETGETYKMLPKQGEIEGVYFENTTSGEEMFAPVKAKLAELPYGLMYENGEIVASTEIRRIYEQCGAVLLSTSRGSEWVVALIRCITQKGEIEVIYRIMDTPRNVAVIVIPTEYLISGRIKLKPLSEEVR